jgi:cyclin B
VKGNKLQEFNKTAGKRVVESIEDIDKKDANNIQACSEYAKDISSYLRLRETTMKYTENYIKEQADVLPEHREKVIEWFIKVQMKYPLKDETIYLAVNILDRFLEKKKLSRGKLSLLGVAAILIAGKYEEIYPPHLSSYIALAEKKLTAEDCLQMELSVLSTLNYDLSTPSVLGFLVRYVKFVDFDKTKQKLAMYICEAQLLTTIMGKYEPSLLALSGLYLTAKTTNKDFTLNEALLKEAKHTEEEVKQCARDMLGNMLVKERIMLSNIRGKYSKHKDVVKVELNTINV